MMEAVVRRFDVLNRGFSGYNTAAARIIVSQFMPKPEQATVSLIVRTSWPGYANSDLIN